LSIPVYRYQFTRYTTHMTIQQAPDRFIVMRSTPRMASIPDRREIMLSRESRSVFGPAGGQVASSPNGIDQPGFLRLPIPP
jgi:hypothetical protein